MKLKLLCNISKYFICIYLPKLWNLCKYTVNQECTFTLSIYIAFEITSEYKVDDAKTLDLDECIRHTPNIEKSVSF